MTDDWDADEPPDHGPTCAEVAVVLLTALAAFAAAALAG